MEHEQLALRLQETTDRSIRNEGRIKKLETEQSVLHQLATSVAVMAERLQTMNDSVDSLTSKVDTLERKPGRRFDAMVDKAVWAVLAALIAYLLGNAGL